MTVKGPAVRIPIGAFVGVVDVEPSNQVQLLTIYKLHLVCATELPLEIAEDGDPIACEARFGWVNCPLVAVIVSQRCVLACTNLVVFSRVVHGKELISTSLLGEDVRPLSQRCVFFDVKLATILLPRCVFLLEALGAYDIVPIRHSEGHRLGLLLVFTFCVDGLCHESLVLILLLICAFVFERDPSLVHVAFFVCQVLINYESVIVDVCGYIKPLFGFTCVVFLLKDLVVHVHGPFGTLSPIVNLVFLNGLVLQLLRHFRTLNRCFYNSFSCNCQNKSSAH